MGLNIANCTITRNAVTVFFSEDVLNATTVANYQILSPLGTAASLAQAPVSYDSNLFAAVVTLSSALANGDWVSVAVVEQDPAHPNGVASVSGDTWDAASNRFLGQVGRPDAGRATSAVEDSVTYPVLNQDIGFTPSPVSVPGGGGAPSGAPGGLALGQVVTKAVSDVLGWKVKADDTKGFLGALTQSFTLTKVEGHTEAKWTPRTYAVQTDLSGGITGAQASLYSRAKDALDQSLPLLDGLYALDPEADLEDVAALKGVAKSQLTELVNELGLLGGPRVTRVNQYFGLLLLDSGSFPPPGGPPTDPDRVGGTLGSLRDQLGLNFTTQDFVNTVEDEQDLSNFRILSDYATSLAQSWIANLSYFGLDAVKPFYGTQLVLLSRQLSVVAESVDEVRFALDSVFIGPAERQTLQIHFAGDSPLFLEDLFSWIKSFASDEGPRLIQDGGKFGVQNTFLPVAQQLQRLVVEAQDPNPANAGLPRGFHTSRVQRALQELGEELGELVTLASPITHQIVEEPPPGTLKKIVDQVSILTAEVNSLRQTAATLTVFPNGTGGITFGNQLVGTTSPPQTVTVVNFSSAPTTNPITVSIIGANAGDFAQTNNCPASVLNALDSCSILVTFTPTAPGARTATLRVTSGGAAQTKTVTLTGTGIQP